MNVLTHLQELFHQALRDMVEDPAPFASMVRATQDPKFGDYQANCAMPLQKKLGGNPREIAQKIVEKLDTGDMLEEPEIAGSGFINLRLKKEWLAEQLQKMAADERLGIAPAKEPKTYVIDYSSPNVAKPMHVGHLRSTIIGDALARLLRFLGHKVISDNHLGDWGKQFGMILWGWKNHRDEKAYEENPVEELARLYRLAQSKIKPYESYGRDLAKVRKSEGEKATELYKKLFPSDRVELSREELERQVDEGREVDQAALAETAKLHEGDAENLALWKEHIPHCLKMLETVYDRLDISFDKQLGESAYQSMLEGVVADLKQKGIAEESEGAIVVFVEKLPAPFIVQKSDGAFNYATTDLATIQYRKKHFDPDVLLYVVDHRQGDHFKALFAVARRWGFDMEMHHLAFGTVMGPDGKPYKTKEGDVVGLRSLLDEGVARARAVVDENSPGISEEEREQIAKVVGIGAIKYADLSQNRTSNYEFNWDKMMAMDGNTATYMQYAYARNCSIFRKGEEDVTLYRTDPPRPLLDTPQERALALELLRFEEALASAVAEYVPHMITSYLWDLSKAYSSFNHACRVLKAETPELRKSRLLLCDLTARVIQKGLELLGIRTIERM